MSAATKPSQNSSGYRPASWQRAMAAPGRRPCSATCRWPGPVPGQGRPSHSRRPGTRRMTPQVRLR
eukprot:6709615-Alexandrium_andersonii.AAC.1